MTAPCLDAASDGLTIDTVPRAGGCLVSVRGDVDAASSPHLRACLLEALDGPGTTTVELDLTGVTFLDSAGLTTLVVAHQTAQRRGRALLLRCGTGRAVRRPLQITGLLGVLTVVDA